MISQISQHLVWFLFGLDLMIAICWIFLFPKAQKVFRYFSWILLLASMCFILYILVLRPQPGSSQVNLLPEPVLIRMADEEGFRKHFLIHLLLFVPFGLSAAGILPDDWHPGFKIGLILLVGLVFGLYIELTQYTFQLGPVDLDDVIAEEIGCAVSCGFLMIRTYNKKKG